MNDTFCQTGMKTALAAALVIGCSLGCATRAHAQEIPHPETSTLITPDAGNSAFLVGHATGTQGYVCLPVSPGSSTASWTVNNARPEATLFTTFLDVQFQIITHFLSPDAHPNKFAPSPLPFGSATWQSSMDSSKVWAQTVHSVPAGSEAACPNAGAIPCLLLQAIGSEDGPGHGATLTPTTFIQRLNTKGGSAPVDGCFEGSDVGKQTLVPYTADYYFFRDNTDRSQR
ncbi:MAG TPA: DUF3455 domain-containing protein [Bryobacteraceae bacterium]|nr:DUF3455 domain-containing protein [Bryobacteraceae bacterium]